MEEITFLIFILSMMLIVAAVSLWSLRPTKKRKPICPACGEYLLEEKFVNYCPYCKKPVKK